MKSGDSNDAVPVCAGLGFRGDLTAGCCPRSGEGEQECRLSLLSAVERDHK